MNLPYFIENPNSFLDASDFTLEDAHSYFVRAIATLYCDGLKYEDIIDGDIKVKLEGTRAAIIKRYQGSYPFLINIINYIYTRDEVINPLGPWIEIPYYLPLGIYDMVAQDFGQSIDPKTLMKLSGLIFALYILSSKMNNVAEDDISFRVQHLERIRESCQFSSIDDLEKFLTKEVFLERKNEFGRLQLVLKPKRLYDLANISQPTFKEYMSNYILSKYGVSFQYDIRKTDRHYQQLYLDNIDSLITKIKVFLDEYSEHYKKLNESVIEIEKSGLNILNHSTLAKACVNYKFKYNRDRSAYFNYPELKGNTFLRIGRRDGQPCIFTQLYVLNYKLLYYSLYCWVGEKSSKLKIDNKGEYFDKKRIKLFRNLKLSNFNSELDLLSNKCNYYGLLSKKIPIDSPISNDSNYGHFKQIKNSQIIIQRISDYGIPISQSKVDQLLKEYESYSIPINQNLIDCFANNWESYQNDFINLSTENSLRLNSEYAWLKKIKASSRQLGRQPNRIYGFFSTHGASTHRMTCRNLNLQGIPRVIRESIFKAREGYSIISFDVSGQDLVVAANLASKMFKDPMMTEIINTELLTELNVKINHTLHSLVDGPKSSPVDFVLSQLNGSPLIQNNLAQHFDMRPLVKKAIYINFYGGGSDAILRTSTLEYFEAINYEIKNKLSELYSLKTISENIFVQTSNIINENLINLNNLNSIANVYSTIALDNEWFITELSIKIEKCKHDIETIKLFIDNIYEIIRLSYPGIIESLPYYKLFIESDKNPHNLTYPTFLGWQTVIDDFHQTRPDYLATRSQSYPIQASGAEFVREWLIEISKLLGYQTQFFICNVVHDQIVIEVKSELIDSLKPLIYFASQKAAKNIGMISSTIKLKVEKLC